MKDFADFIKILIDRPWHFFCLGVIGLVILCSPRLEEFLGLQGCRATVGATTVIAIVWGSVCFVLHLIPKWATWCAHRKICASLQEINDQQWQILDGFWQARKRTYYSLYRDNSNVRDLVEKGILNHSPFVACIVGDPTSDYEIPQKLWDFLKETRWGVAS